MDSEYVLWTYKIYCSITPTNHIARKFNLLLHIPYKDNIIEKSSYKFYIEVTGSYRFSAQNIL